MHYFHTAGAGGPFYPTVFDQLTAVSNTVWGYTVTGCTWSDTINAVQKTGGWTALPTQVGLPAYISGTGVYNPRSPHAVSSNNNNRIVLADTIGHDAAFASDITAITMVAEFSPYDTVVLRGVNVLVPPNTLDNINIVDKTGAVIMPLQISGGTAPAVGALGAQQLSINGIVCPLGGFGIQTSIGATVYQWLFDLIPSNNP